MPDKVVFLVEVKTFLLGGGEVSSFDVVEAEDCDSARNIAFNSYLLGGESMAVNFGRKLFMPGTIGAVHVGVLGVLDMEHDFNEQWQFSIDASKKWEKQLEEMLQKDGR